MLDFFDSIANITVIFSSLLAIVLMLKYNELNSILKLVAIYIIGSAAIDIVSTAFYEIQESNLIFLHLFSLFEIIVITKLFKLVYRQLKCNLKIEYIGFSVALFVIYNSYFLQNLNTYNTYSSSLVSIAILGYCIYYFLKLLDLDISNFEFIVLKWFIFTLFIYHSVSIIIMLFGNLIETMDKTSQVYIWTFRILVTLLTKVVLIFYFSKLFLKTRNLKADE